MEPVGQRARRHRQRRRQRQCRRRVTYNAGGVATGIDYRLSPQLPRRPRHRLLERQPVAERLQRPRHQQQLPGQPLRLVHPGGVLPRCPGGLRLQRQPDDPADRHPRPAAAHGDGPTGANQFVGQIEAGYRIGIYEQAAATLTPFARLQGVNNSQAAFSETGAGSLSLNVAQQTTNSVRSTIGVRTRRRHRRRLARQAGAAAPPRLGTRICRHLAPGDGLVRRRTGQQLHRVRRAPQRDTATLGFAANTAIAERTSIYFRYDGEVGTGTDNHAFSAGLRMTW